MAYLGSGRLALLATALWSMLTLVGARAEPAVEAQALGPDLPPTGRSLFDRLVYDEAAPQPQLAFPFSALLTQLRDALGVAADADDPFTVVLLPIGRSLQRHAAAPAVFESPRVVAALTGADAPAGPVALRDRLYLGYQAESGVIEIISYNAAAGRFEFQVIKDYRPGGEPRLFYAKRVVCAACHQNQAPIFPRPLWSETNANPAVAARLQSAAAPRTDYDGIPFVRGIDGPAAIDAASDRANLFAVWQRLWQEGCAIAEQDARQCRRQLAAAALTLGLNGWRGAPLDAAPPALDRQALREALQRRWPDGLALPNADIPNRDPLLYGTAVAGREVPVPAAVDPLQRRAPSGWLHFDAARGSDALNAWIQGLAEAFDRAQIEALDAALSASDATPVATRLHYADCRRRNGLDARGDGRIDLQCGGAAADLQLQARLYFAAGRFQRGVLDRLQVGTERLNELHLLPAEPPDGQAEAASLTLNLRNGGLSARRATGQRLAWIAFDALFDEGASAQVRIQEIDDIAHLARALSAVPPRLFDLGAFQPGALFAAVQAELPGAAAPPEPTVMAGTQTALPAPLTEPHAPMQVRPLEAGDNPALSGVLATLQRYCAACHASAEDFPPNFLSGDLARVQDNLMQCSERLEQRIGMWSVPAAEREKTPMPPPIMVESVTQLEADPAWARLREYMRSLRTLRYGSVDARAPARAYEALQPCLPDRPSEEARAWPATAAN